VSSRGEVDRHALIVSGKDPWIAIEYGHVRSPSTPHCIAWLRGMSKGSQIALLAQVGSAGLCVSNQGSQAAKPAK